MAKRPSKGKTAPRNKKKKAAPKGKKVKAVSPAKRRPAVVLTHRPPPPPADAFDDPTEQVSERDIVGVIEEHGVLDQLKEHDPH